MSELINNAFANIDPENEQFVNKNIDIVEEIVQLLKDKKVSKSKLATMLGKKPAEITKLLSGIHNLTLRSITKMEVALGEDIIITASEARKKYEHVNYIHTKDAGLNSEVYSLENVQPAVYVGKESNTLKIA